MIKRRYIKFLLLVTVLIPIICGFTIAYDDDWGFFAHKRINRLAVFTLPQEMLPLFKNSIEFLSEHAVDPDKRRYAVKNEASRHYLDMDMYHGKCLPHNFSEAFSIYGHLMCIAGKDTFYIHAIDSSWCNDLPVAVFTDGNNKWEVSKKQVRNLYSRFVINAYHLQDYTIPIDSIRPLLGPMQNRFTAVSLIDHFTEHGIVPYHIESQYNRLVRAFSNRDFKAVIDISADLGHYVADAHVPLHACSNYNGQLSGQHGIHAFWESRIPELFADERYDFFVGKATYIEDIRKFAWETITYSGNLSDTVLNLEKKLRAIYPEDRQMCFDERLGVMTWVQCRDYADAYDKIMDGMVETRMRDAIQSVGSIWMSAWIDAGQPELDEKSFKAIDVAQDSILLEYEQKIKSGSQGFGRYHE